MNWTIAAAVIVGVLAAARLTRLLAHDTFPPAAWARGVWDRLTGDGHWNSLIRCHWCLSPYMAALVMAPALIWGLTVPWWVVNGWLAGSYVAAMVVERDEVGD